MARWRHAVELALTDEEIKSLGAIARSRSDPARRVERARMLLVYRENFSFFAVGQRLGVHHQTVERCVERAVAYGPLAALDDRPRPGKEPTITLEAKAWLVSLACDKAKEHGYPHELWTTRLLARHARENAPAAGHRDQPLNLPWRQAEVRVLVHGNVLLKFKRREGLQRKRGELGRVFICRFPDLD
jgi:transposase